MRLPCLSPKTVDFHRQKILDKMQARNQTDLARLVITARAAGPVPRVAVPA